MTTLEKPRRSLFGRMFSVREQAAVADDDSLEATGGEPLLAQADDRGVDVVDVASVEQTSDEPAAENPARARQNWLQRLKAGLAKTSTVLSRGITDVFNKRKLDAATLEDLEDLLIQADLGLETTGRITSRLKADRFDKAISPEEVREVLISEIANVLEPIAQPLLVQIARRPHVILMVGVNGTGKTTTIGKLAERYRGSGYKVMLAAGDTFRAASIDQLKIWGERTGSTVIARPVGSDSASLAFEAVTEAKAGQFDVLLIDTAGRLQNKDDLMRELEKVVRVIRKVDPQAPHDVVLTLDATTGQNALNQVDVFGKRAGVTGLIMTKLDGTARGGILVAIAATFRLPVHAIGVGEKADDLQPFDARDFARAIAGE